MNATIKQYVDNIVKPHLLHIHDRIKKERELLDALYIQYNTLVNITIPEFKQNCIDRINALRAEFEALKQESAELLAQLKNDVLNVLNAHINRKDNPHKVTLAQLGGLTTAQIDALINNYFTPLLTPPTPPNVNLNNQALFDVEIYVGTISILWYNLKTGEMKAHLENRETYSGDAMWPMTQNGYLNQRVVVNSINSYNTNALTKPYGYLNLIKRTSDPDYDNYLYTHYVSTGNSSMTTYINTYSYSKQVAYGFTNTGLCLPLIDNYRKITTSLEITQKYDTVVINTTPTKDNGWWAGIIIRDHTRYYPHANWYKFKLLLTANM
jgi:septum formation topological specificity factor MinE